MIKKNASLSLGSGYIDSNCNINVADTLEIGQKAAIAENFTIRDSDSHNLVSNPNHFVTKSIKTGNHVWIGINVTVLKGITIGNGAVIVAGAVVTRDLPPYGLAAGVPAKVIKENVQWK